MVGDTSCHIGPNRQSGSGLPSDEEIMQALTLPENWSVENDTERRGFAGYSVVGGIKNSEKEQGLLLADQEYQRIACVLYPTSDSFRKYNIEATQAVADSVDLSNHLAPLEAEIENHSEKLSTASGSSPEA
jgi:hypothetical protein